MLDSELTAELVEAVRARGEAEALLVERQADVRSRILAASWSGASFGSVAQVIGCSRQAVAQLVARASASERREWEEAQLGAKFERYAERERAVSERGLERRSFQCPSCHRFKGKPSDRCDFCGDEMGTHNGDPHELNRAYGYAA